MSNISFERVEYFTCSGNNLTHQNSIHENMKSSLCQGLPANIRWRIFCLLVCYPKKLVIDNLFHGTTAFVGQGVLIIKASRSHSDTSHSVGFIWTSQPATETSTWQHAALQETDNHAPSWIRSHKPTKRAAADPRLRPRPLVQVENEKYSNIVMPVLLYGCEPWWRSTGWGLSRIGWLRKIFAPKRDELSGEWRKKI